MERLGLFLCHYDDHHPDQLTQVAAFPLPTADVRVLQPETALDEMETTTQQIGVITLSVRPQRAAKSKENRAYWPGARGDEGRELGWCVQPVH